MAVAGGKKELQQAARQIRQARSNVQIEDGESPTKPTSKASLVQENQELKLENQALKEKIDELSNQLKELSRT